MDIVFHREQLVVNTGRVKGIWRMMGPTARESHPKNTRVSVSGRGEAPAPGMKCQWNYLERDKGKQSEPQAKRSVQGDPVGTMA